MLHLKFFDVTILLSQIAKASGISDLGFGSIGKIEMLLFPDVRFLAIQEFWNECMMVQEL